MDYLLEFCRTPRQTEIIQACIDNTSSIAAAAALGINIRNIQHGVNRVKRYAESKGIDPSRGLNIGVAPGMGHAGTSTLHGPNGEVKLQWIKTKENADHQEALLAEYLEALKDELSRELPIQPPKVVSERLLNCYVISDYHIGSLSWSEETMGEAWDTQIAEDMLVNWFRVAIDESPGAKVGLLAQLGDFLHFDGLAAVTPTSGHQLDTDTRFQKIVRVAIRALRKIIGMLLAKHETVHLIMAEGNHDLAASAWLRELLFAFYEDEPRITVDRSAHPYYAYEHGSTALFFHHGHIRRVDGIADIFAAQFRELYGRTRHAFVHVGHLHHDKLIESNLMTCEQHRTIAAPDAYAAKGGWLSGRGAKVITYDVEWGEVGRVIISPDRVKATF
jgi:hypothetical protein